MDHIEVYVGGSWAPDAIEPRLLFHTVELVSYSSSRNIFIAKSRIDFSRLRLRFSAIRSNYSCMGRVRYFMCVRVNAE